MSISWMRTTWPFPPLGPLSSSRRRAPRPALVVPAEASMKALARSCTFLCLVSALHATARSEEKNTETGRPHDMVLIPGGKFAMGLTREQQQKFATEYQ